MPARASQWRCGLNARYCWCRGEMSGTMLRCWSCAEWVHGACETVRVSDMTPAEIGGWRCRSCTTGTPSPRTPFTFSEVFSGSGGTAYCIDALTRLGMFRAYEHVWSCEIDAECRQFVNAVNRMRPGVLSQAVYRTRDHSFGPPTSICCRTAAGSFLAENFLLMKPEMVPKTDFGIIGFPCVKFSKNHNGHDVAVDIDDPTTLALVQQLIAFLRAHAWKVVAIECVAGFFRSRAWEMIVREGVRGSQYELLCILHADSEAMGLPQIRDRRIAVLSTLPPARDLRSCFDELARMEARDRTTLADCILDAEQMRACYVSRAALRQVCARTSAKAF